MSYVKNVWVNGDVITEDKLNHMEEGIKEASQGGGGGGSGTFFVVNLSYDDDLNVYVADKTFLEIQTNIQSGVFPVLYNDGNVAYFYNLITDDYIDFREIPTIDQQSKQCTGGHYFINADESIVSDTDIIWGA